MIKEKVGNVHTVKIFFNQILTTHMCNNSAVVLMSAGKRLPAPHPEGVERTSAINFRGKKVSVNG